MKNKNFAGSNTRFDAPGGSCGMGCFTFGCLGILVVVFGLMVSGYYSVFHSSLPLRIIEAAIEEDGEAEIDGLTGTLSTGFSADELRFKSHDDHWSKLTGIEFRYESDSSFFRTDTVLIKELSVDSGTIYADWDPDEQEIDFDLNFDEEISDINDEFEEIGEEIDDEVGHALGMKELRIDLVSIANLKIINPETDFEITIEEIKFEDFQLKDGVLQNLGQLAVTSSQLELQTVPSVEFTDIDNAQRFQGILRSSADHRLHSDVPFSVDFGVDKEFKGYAKYELFDQKLVVTQLPEKTSLHYVEFNPADFIKTQNGGLLPSQINIELEFDDPNSFGPAEVDENGSFELGKSKFTKLQIQPSGKRKVILGEANVAGHTISSTVSIRAPFAPWREIRLQSETLDSEKDVWAWTVFGKPFEDLPAEQQHTVVESIRSYQSPGQRKSDNNAEAKSETSSDGNAESSSPNIPPIPETNEVNAEMSPAASDND